MASGVRKVIRAVSALSLPPHIFPGVLLTPVMLQSWIRSRQAGQGQQGSWVTRAAAPAAAEVQRQPQTQDAGSRLGFHTGADGSLYCDALSVDTIRQRVGQPSLIRAHPAVSALLAAELLVAFHLTFES